MKRAKFRSLFVEGLEERIALSSLSEINPSSQLQPIVIDHLNTGKEQAPKAFVRGNATLSLDTPGQVNMNGGSAYITPFGHLPVSNGEIGPLKIINGHNKVTFSGVNGDVILQPKNRNLGADLSFITSTPASETTIGPRTRLDYTLEISRSFVSRNAGVGIGVSFLLIRSGMATLSFPDGVPSADGVAKPYLITFDRGH
jgi:hypothetical protein